MTDKHADIRENLAKITPEPWAADNEEWPGNDNLRYWVGNMEDGFICAVRKEDAQFIANAPEYIRRLLDEVERLSRPLVVSSAIRRLGEENEKLREENKDYDNKIVDLLDKIHDLHAKNNRVSVEKERLRKALEEIANMHIPHSDTWAFDYVPDEMQEIARKALEGKE